MKHKKKEYFEPDFELLKFSFESVLEETLDNSDPEDEKQIII